MAAALAFGERARVPQSLLLSSPTRYTEDRTFGGRFSAGQITESAGRFRVLLHGTTTMRRAQSDTQTRAGHGPTDMYTRWSAMEQRSTPCASARAPRRFAGIGLGAGSRLRPSPRHRHPYEIDRRHRHSARSAASPLSAAGRHADRARRCRLTSPTPPTAATT